jgi:hypothetical protein
MFTLPMHNLGARRGGGGHCHTLAVSHSGKEPVLIVQEADEPRAVLDGYVISRTHRGLNFGPCRAYFVAIPTALSQPPNAGCTA